MLVPQPRGRRSTTSSRSTGRHPRRLWLGAFVAVAASLAYASPAACQAIGSPAAPLPAPSPDYDPYGAYITEASHRFGVPEAWIRAVMRVESAGNPSATSHAGAMGLMQVMPATYAELRARHGLGENAYDPRDSILAGTAYLREMHDRYGSAGFLAAYNAGPGRWEDHVYRGRALPAETVAYVARLQPLVGGAAAAPLAVAARAEAPSVTRPRAVSWTQSALFVRVATATAAASGDADAAQAANSSVAGARTPGRTTSEVADGAASRASHGLFAVSRPQ